MWKRKTRSILLFSKQLKANALTRRQQQFQRQSPCWIIIRIGVGILAIITVVSLSRFYLSDRQRTIIMKDDLVHLLTLAEPPIVMSHTNDLEMAHHITKLNIPHAGLEAIPVSICEGLPQLSILFAPNNHITELPPHMGVCRNLQMMSFKTNNMKTIHPEALQNQLRWLILTDNQIATLPTTIGKCQNLQKLMLSGNALTHIPDNISNCHSLELVRLASNQLTQPPMTLLQLPNLAWVALSANPFLDTVPRPYSTIQLPLLDDPVLDSEQHGDILGQGASGITRKVYYQNNYVAVKTYKSTMTSDGSPLQEKDIAMIASTIPSDCLIKVLGQTPQGSLVMELLSNVRAFGQPPSMESCSRDVYDDTDTITEHHAKAMVTGLVTILVELHRLGIMHGDLYGHNILVSKDKTEDWVKLSDFGAAFFYDTTADYGVLLQKIEMRAFGILVSEIELLLGRTEMHSTLREPLKQIVQASRTKITFAELQELWMSLLMSLS